MKITQQEQKGAIVFTLDGRIDSAGVADLEQTLRRSVEAGHHKMVLDMAGVQYINSAGLRILADILTQNRSHGGDLRLVALNPKVERVFKIIGFDRFFDVYDNVPDALTGL